MATVGSFTDRREGAEFSRPVMAKCPGCGREDTTRHQVNLCAKCGEWFEVA